MPESVQVPSRRKLVREISIFLMGIGILTGGLGCLLLISLSRKAPPISGVARHLALGIPLLSLGGLQCLSGMLFLMTRRAAWAAMGALASAFISVMAFVLGGISLITLLLAVAPVMLGQRISALAKAKDDEPGSLRA